MKLIMRNQSVNIRSLYQLKDKTYIVRIENYNFKTKSYNPSYDVSFGMFSEALNCVNFKNG